MSRLSREGLTVVGREEHGEQEEHSDVLEHVQELLEFLLGADSSLELDNGTVTSDDLI